MGRMKLSVPSYFFLLVFFLLIFFHMRGVIIHDEGYILNSAEKVLSGLTIYKDFHFSYTPGSVYAVALSFIFFGHTVFASRILMVLISLLGAFLIFKIAIKITKREIYGYVSTIIFLAWGPTHINFAWPVMFVLPTTLLILYLLVTYHESKKPWIPFVVGLLCVVVFLFKQNFGIIILPAIVALITAKKIKSAHILNALYGLLWGVILFSIYLLLTNSLSSFLSDFYEFTIRKVLINSEITTPLIYKDTFIKTLARLALYFSPFYLSIIAIGISIYRKRYHLIYIPLTVLLFLIVGIRPTTDYVHIVPIISLIGLPLIIITNQFPTTLTKLSAYSFAVLIILLGFHSSLFRGYYRWDIPLGNNNYFAKNRLDVFTNSQFSQELELMRITADKYSKKNDYIFVNTYAPLLYFVLERKSPTKYDFPGFAPSEVYEKSVIYALITKDVKLIFILSENDTSAIGKFTYKYYKKVRQIGNYYLYSKLDNPHIER